MRPAMLMCAAVLVLMGCETKQDSGTLMGAIAGGVIGNQFGKGGGRVASTFAGAVIGGIVGNEIGRSMHAIASSHSRPSTTLGNVGKRVARYAGKTPTMGVTVRSSPRNPTGAAPSIAATTCTRSISTGDPRRCVARPAAMPMGPGAP
jgi:predicted lipid-binding transport protein (Tim44 family)